MLVYEKKVEGQRKIFGTLENIPSAEDEALVYTTEDGTEIDDLTLNEQYVDSGNGGIIRVADNTEIFVSLDSTVIVPPNGEIVPVLESIEVTTLPTITTYGAAHQKYDWTGMVVTATYTDGTTAAVTGYTTSPADGADVPNDNTTVEVTVTYEGKTDTFEVTVQSWE